MRNTILTIAPVLLSATLSAQGVFSNKTQDILQKVIRDYPNHFYNIKGDLIKQARQTAEYKSTIQLPGTAPSVITFTNAHQTGYTWSCILMPDGNFDAAKARFAEVYKQISNSIVSTESQKTFILSGQYEEPTAGKSTRITFSLLPGVGDMKKLKVSLVLHQDEKEYNIYLTVTDLDLKEEEVQGAFTAN